MPLSAESRLVLVRVKIERAKKHLCDLETLLRDFRGVTQYVVIRDGEFKPGFNVPLVKLPKRPFDALSCTGDIIQNLRSALDHLAWQLVLAAGNTPSSATAFPIAEDAATYNKIKARKVYGMRPDAIKRIDLLKPYKGGNDPLWKIHELNNIDKHRMLLTVHNDCLFFADWMGDINEPFLLKTDDSYFSGFLDAKVEQDMELEIDEALGKLQVAHGDPLLPSLHQLTDFVSDLVLSFKSDIG